MNKSNNPLMPSIGLDLRDRHVGRYYRADDDQVFADLNFRFPL